MKTGVPGVCGKRVRRRKAAAPAVRCGRSRLGFGPRSRGRPAPAAVGRRVEMGAASRSSGASQETAGSGSELSDRLRQPDNLHGGTDAPTRKTHGFVPLPHSRFTFIGAIVVFPRIMLTERQRGFEYADVGRCLSRTFNGCLSRCPFRRPSC